MDRAEILSGGIELKKEKRSLSAAWNPLTSWQDLQPPLLLGQGEEVPEPAPLGIAPDFGRDETTKGSLQVSLCQHLPLT